MHFYMINTPLHINFLKKFNLACSFASFVHTVFFSLAPQRKRTALSLASPNASRSSKWLVIRKSARTKVSWRRKSAHRQSCFSSWTNCKSASRCSWSSCRRRRLCDSKPPVTMRYVPSDRQHNTKVYLVENSYKCYWYACMYVVPLHLWQRMLQYAVPTFPAQETCHQLIVRQSQQFLNVIYWSHFLL